MKIVEKDIWEAHAEGCTIVVPTNGSVNRLGHAVMGRGVARQAAGRFLMLARELGNRLVVEGNRVYHFRGYRLFTFPVKRVWHEMAQYDLVRRSSEQLLSFLGEMPDLVPVYMPKVGCGNGRLRWESVEPILDAILRDMAIVASLKREANAP